MSLILKPLVRDIILANYTVSAGLCRLNQAFAGLRQAATERKYGWLRIPGDGDQRFPNDRDRDSWMIVISVPTEGDQ